MAGDRSPRVGRARRIGLAALSIGSLVAWMLCGSAGSVSATDQTPAPSPATGSGPVFAYYYIWYTPGSWTRAKRDQPLLGSYDSSDASVIAQHVTWAREAGIDGFIVSWKHEPRLDKPLELLVREAERQHFKLILLYEGLDFNRNPIGAARVAADLKWFETTYGSDPVFQVFGPPTVIWSGSSKYTPAEIAAVRSAVQAPSQILLLGSERSAADYVAREHLLDGDAYYWSSADPLNTPGYEQRLDGLAKAVAAANGKWIAPVAPGFDARLVGGSSTVERRDGATYRASWATAAATKPSALGIISWNEFSENSHIEPSKANGFAYLTITSQLTGKPGAGPVSQTLASPVVDVSAGGTDSSELTASISRNQQLLSILVSLALLALLTFHAVRLRRRHA